MELVSSGFVNNKTCCSLNSDKNRKDEIGKNNSLQNRN
jgi:hypothetical protein